MYHRYMPTENGQYQRKSVPEHTPPMPQPKKTEQEMQHRQESAPMPKAERIPSVKPAPQELQPPTIRPSVLEKLLPGVDSGDLLVLLILLFLLSEGNEDSPGMIMTLAIFLFLQ